MSLALAAPAVAGESYDLWPPADTHHGGELNGKLGAVAFTGGVGNTHGSYCCSDGGFAFYGGARRQGMEGDIAFRSARDAAFANPFSGPRTDRAFRFRANSIQANGF